MQNTDISNLQRLLKSALEALINAKNVSSREENPELRALNRKLDTLIQDVVELQREAFATWFMDVSRRALAGDPKLQELLGCTTPEKLNALREFCEACAKAGSWNGELPEFLGANVIQLDLIRND